MNYLDIKIWRALALLLVLTLAASLAGAQDDSGSGNAGAVPAATAPAEQNNIENPPLSSLDQPTAEPAFGGRSYLMPGFQISESVDSNVANTANTRSHPSEITRALASVDLQKIWRQYQFGLDYIGAGDFYAGPLVISNQPRATQNHTLGAVQRVLWRTGQLAIRDSFDYLPEGSFGFSSYGGAASVGSSLGNGVSGTGAGTGLGGGLGSGLPGIGGASFGSVLYQPRIDNSAIVDIVQGLSPRSTITMAGGYSLTHYLSISNPTFLTVNSQQVNGQIGYNRLLSRKDQIGFQYAFQEVHFPRAGSGTVNVHIWDFLYGHRVSGRLNLTLAGGPQLVIVRQSILGPQTTSMGANGSVTLGYTVSSRTNITSTYQHYITPGSGFFAGANTDAARVAIGHRFGRRWTTTTDAGYSRNTNLQKSSLTTTPGVHSRAYQYWYAGTSLQRQLSEHFSAFVSYQFNDMGIGKCSGVPITSGCGLGLTRHTGMIGINWHPRPIRLD